MVCQRKIANFNFLVNFFNMDISLDSQHKCLRFCMCVVHNDIEGTVSQILFRSYFLFYEILKKKFEKMTKSYPFFDIK